MRLSPEELAAIRSTAREVFGASVGVWLFGSRVDDNKRGGDIDLLIETEETDVSCIALAELAFLTKVKAILGERHIDLLVDYPTRRVHPPIYAIARNTGVRL